jgi:hypothetical protein
LLIIIGYHLLTLAEPRLVIRQFFFLDRFSFFFSIYFFLVLSLDFFSWIKELFIRIYETMLRLHRTVTESTIGVGVRKKEAWWRLLQYSVWWRRKKAITKLSNNPHNFITTSLSLFYSVNQKKKVYWSNDHFSSVELDISKKIERQEVKQEYLTLKYKQSDLFLEGRISCINGML